MNWISKLKSRAFEPVDGASLVFFRVGFGLIMLIEVYRYFAHDWIERKFIRPEFYFKFYGFEWVNSWPGVGMYWHFIAIGVVSFLIMIGAFYRLATIVFVILFSYVFLLDQTHYLNHFYFVILLAVLLCVVPANRAFSVDAWLRPGIKTQCIPAWALWIFIIQIEIMLLYAGIVKINNDWLHLQPLSMWWSERQNLPVLGQLMTQTWYVALCAYGSVILHVLGAPLLLFKSTRFWVFLLYCGFHIMNHTVFNIGIFPWLTIVGTTLFFNPNWPRVIEKKIVNFLGRYIRYRTEKQQTHVIQNLVDSWQTSAKTGPGTFGGNRAVIFAFLLFWTASQILIPLRHVLYPGPVSWTEEGHRFAWQMKLRDKTGLVKFTVHDSNSIRSWNVEHEQYLTAKQVRKFSCRPDMLLQFAHYIADQWEENYGIENPEVYANVKCSLNNRPFVQFIDPQVNLAEVERNLRQANWILPLTEPLVPDGTPYPFMRIFSKVENPS